MTSIGVDTGGAGEVPGLQDEGEEAQQEAASCEMNLGVTKLHASRPRLKLLFEQFIISSTPREMKQKQRTSFKYRLGTTAKRNKVSINSPDHIPLVL